MVAKSKLLLGWQKLRTGSGIDRQIVSAIVTFLHWLESY